MLMKKSRNVQNILNKTEDSIDNGSGTFNFFNPRDSLNAGNAMTQRNYHQSFVNIDSSTDTSQQANPLRLSTIQSGANTLRNSITNLGFHTNRP